MLIPRIFSRGLAGSSKSAIPMGSLKSSVAESQLKALEQEQCILVDETDTITGVASKLHCHKWDGTSSPLHRAFSLFLFNDKQELLVHQRSFDKVTFPGHYTNSCCSHPLAIQQEKCGVQGVKTAAHRRAGYELGIPSHQFSAADLVFLTRILYSGRAQGSPYAEHEVDYILFLQKDNLSLAPRADEVRSVEWVARDHLHQYLADLAHRHLHLTPWFSFICQRFLLHWWDNLDRLHELQDSQTIHRQH